jgi:hypothetical protein
MFEYLKKLRYVYQGENKLLLPANDPELRDWIFNASDKNRHAGSFVRAIADAAVRADPANYQIIRGALLALKAKYPDYALSVEEVRGRVAADHSVLMPGTVLHFEPAPDGVTIRFPTEEKKADA